MINPNVVKPVTNKTCETCTKNDVCMYKAELVHAVEDIEKISDRTNVFIDVTISCKHWAGAIAYDGIRGTQKRNSIEVIKAKEHN